MELVGRLPSNTLNGTTSQALPDLYPDRDIPAQPLRGFTKRQRFGLGEEVRQQFLV